MKKLSIQKLLISLAIIIVCSCSKGGDVTKPTIVSTTPEDGATSVEISDPMTVVFSENMNAGSIINTYFVLTSESATVSTSVSYDEELKIATIYHAGNLENSTEYTLTVSGQVEDANGNKMGDDYSFSFTTADLLTGTLSWDNPLPQGNTLNGVWPASETDIFGVGNAGSIIHSNGTTWTVMDSNTNVDLMAIWGTSANNVYAVGDTGVIMHYDGSSWSLSYIEPEASKLYSIWGNSASDIFVGSNEGILHWNGSEWSEMTIPEEAKILSIWGFSSNDVYATDSTTRLLRYNGSSWSIFKDFYGDTILRAVWGTSSSDLYTGGFSPFELYHVYHYDGLEWSIQEDINTGIDTIWGSSSDNVYVAGTSGFMMHYDGSTWSDVSRHYVQYKFINGTAANNIYTVGDYGLIEYNDGTSWEIQNGTYIWSLYDVWGIDENNIYAVGSSGTVLNFDGTTWNKLDPLAASRNNYGITGTAADNIYVVNCYDDSLMFDGGDVFQYDGVDWSAVVEDPLVCFQSVWVSDDNNVFAVGYNEDHEGWIYRYNGTSWGNAELESVTRPTSVSGSSKTNVIAVGINGTASIFNGTSWQAMNTGTNASINSVIVFSETEAYAVDENGLLISYDGNENLEWSTISRVATTPITKIWGSSGDDLFMVAEVHNTYGVGGVNLIIHYDGSSFSQIESIADKALFSAWGSSGDNIYFVGNSGVILHYEK